MNRSKIILVFEQARQERARLPLRGDLPAPYPPVTRARSHSLSLSVQP